MPVLFITHYTLIRNRGIELQPALNLANLSCLIKDDETWGKGELAFHAVPVKILIRVTGLGAAVVSISLWWKWEGILCMTGSHRGALKGAVGCLQDARVQPWSPADKPQSSKVAAVWRVLQLRCSEAALTDVKPDLPLYSQHRWLFFLFISQRWLI